EVGDDDKINVAGTLDNPRFDRPFGGLYWQVRTPQSLFTSRSLWDQIMELPSVVQPGKVERYRDINSNVGELMAIKRIVIPGSGKEIQQVELIVAQEQSDLEKAIVDFRSQVLLVVGLLALFLLSASTAQILIGLRPLSTIRTRLSQMIAEKSDSLKGNFPSEVQPLVRQINDLLLERSAMVERARSGASDLAHGLKTPLAIMQAEARSLNECGNKESAAEIERQIAAMNNHVERQLARTRAESHVSINNRLLSKGTELKPACERLINAFAQMPRGEEIDWQLDIGQNLIAEIDPVDFEEVVGNLLDNARKWAADTVRVVTTSEDNKVKITISDNGPGVPAGEMPFILTRGGRLDEHSPGSGLGLTIARDIAEIYNGELAIRQHEPSGLTAVLTLPVSHLG
ncbi:MAG: sensor histidine kinase, partial [Methyloligellaceae bacterium]